MKTFKITFSDCEIVYYTNEAIVEADSPEEAVEKVKNGKAKESEVIYSDYGSVPYDEIIDGSFQRWTVDKIEELPTLEQQARKNELIGEWMKITDRIKIIQKELEEDFDIRF